MPLSNKDLSEIAKEFSVAKGEISDDKSAIPNIQDQITKKEEQGTRMYIPYNNAQVERVTPYETEHRWLTGLTYTTITQQQIDDAAARTTANIFFPASWAKSNAQLTASGNGNPKTTSPNSEQAVLNAAVENNGLISQIGLLRSGQSSSAPSRSLDNAYAPGGTTLTFTNNHSFTIGRYLYVSGSGTSALVRITATPTSDSVTISEIIAPASTISFGGSAVEAIPGFSNSDRQSLTSGTYQRILTELTNRIASAATLYNTALSNQLTQLNLNIDNAAQTTSAKNSVSAGQTGYSTWNGLSNTGVTGKWVDTSLDNFATSYNNRVSAISTRSSQIITALGTVTQDSNGNYSGNGLYLQRFKTLNFLINSSSGPLFQLNGLRSAKTNFEQRVKDGTDKLATFSNLVRYGAFADDVSGNTVKIDTASQFAISDAILLTGNDLPSIQCTISNIVGNLVTLSIPIPPEYTKDVKAGIIKAV